MGRPRRDSGRARTLAGLGSVLFALFGAGLSIDARAADGIQEINQASALAGGGFPVVLSAPGSYRLTSNLDLGASPAGTTAISIAAQDVYLDLAGFSIRGPLTCTTSPPPAGSGSGVASSAAGTTVTNGSVTGFGGSALFLSEQARVASVSVRCSGGTGIRAGREARIEGNRVHLSAVGVQTGANSLLIDNEITRNAGFGLVGGALTALRGNVFAENNGGDGNPQLNVAQGLLELGSNRCGATLSCASGALCGNGVPESGEGCDDEGTTNGDGCSASCAVEPGFFCSGAPSVCVPSVCGDGVVDGGDLCDDGNTTNGDGCSSFCTVEPGFTCTGLQPSICFTVCGDGVVGGIEGCDDANTNFGDGCTGTCQVEPGFVCTGTPSICTMP